MAEENAQEQETQVTGERPSGYFAFNEKPAMLQLREPYIGCTYAHIPAMNKEGGAIAVPVLSGVLHVEPDGAGGIMLVVEMPTGSGKDFALVAVSPRDVLYCTHIHQSRIVTQ